MVATIERVRGRRSFEPFMELEAGARIPAGLFRCERSFRLVSHFSPIASRLAARGSRAALSSPPRDPLEPRATLAECRRPLAPATRALINTEVALASSPTSCKKARAHFFAPPLTLGPVGILSGAFYCYWRRASVARARLMADCYALGRAARPLECVAPEVCRS